MIIMKGGLKMQKKFTPMQRKILIFILVLFLIITAINLGVQIGKP